MATLAFDVAHARRILTELALRLEAFDSFESIPSEIRDVIDEALAGRGFEFSYVRGGAAGGAGDRLLKVQIVGALDEALSALRAMQGDLRVAHA